MSKYYGNITQEDTIELSFNTFDTLGASVTVTDLALTDIHIHKDGGTTQRASTVGITLSIDYDGIVGNHLIAIDTSDDTDAGFYVAGSNYEVRLEGITVDTQTINAFIGSFSIENRIADADILRISGDATAADNLEAQYDGSGLAGDTFPATQAQIGNLSTGSAAVSTTAASLEDTTPAPIGTDTNDYTSTVEEDGIYHSWVHDLDEIELAYNFNIGANAAPVDALWIGYAQSINKEVAVYARNWVSSIWEQVGSIIGTAGATQQTITFNLTVAHVDTGANSGNVRIRFHSTDIASFATDRMLLSYTITNQSVGYANGQIWVDTEKTPANEHTVSYVDGTADNPVTTWAAALILSANLGINRFHMASHSSVTLTESFEDKTMVGEHYFAILNGQNIDDAYFAGADISGVSAVGDHTTFDHCRFNGVTISPGIFTNCGFGVNSGVFAAQAGDGEYVFHNCFSLVPGSGTPEFDFSAITDATGINNRAWTGGCSYILNDYCTLSHEVLAGGGTTIVTGGADCEIRGITRELTITMSAAEQVQFVGITGDILLQGNTTGTVNLYGVAAVVTDNTAATVDDSTVSQTNINTECDTALTDYAPNTVVPMSDSDSINEHNATRSAMGNLHDFDPDNDSVAHVALVTENSDMVGTDGANTVVPDVAGTAATLHTATDADIAAIDTKLGTPSDTDIATDLVNLKNLSEFDTYIDITTTPWELQIRTKGTTDILLKKKLYDTNGNDITDVGTLVGRMTHTS